MSRPTIRTDLSPGEVVARAYRAANRGRYAEAGRYLHPSVLHSTRESARLMRESRQRLAERLALIAHTETRADLARLATTAKQFEDPNYCWKLSTRSGSLASVEVARETIRGDKATVTLRLRLADGTIATEREPLVRTPFGWRVGAIIALENNGMHQTNGRGKRRPPVRR